MLDLTMMNDDLYEVRLLNGKELKLKRPTQKMYEQILLINERDKTDSKTLQLFASVFTSILNRNTEGIVFKEVELAEEYDITVMGILLKDYFLHWNQEIASKINFQ